jgi:erythromycin esterase-like protein
MIRLRQLGRQEAQTPAGLTADVRKRSRPLRGPEDLDPLLERIDDARLVLLGEASHGTADYHTWRAELSRRLILEKDFVFLAVEGDWPDCYRVNRYVKGDLAGSARDVLQVFRRWPTWMWANEEVADLADWLRQHNEGLPEGQKVGFFGLDVYSLWDSLYQVMGYLRRVDPDALEVARRAYHCFEAYGEDVQEYARASRFVPDACEAEVVALLQEMRRKAGTYAARDRDAAFQAEQNALVLKNAEAYYRAMVRGGPQSWNLRDRHMSEILDRLLNHHGPKAKAIVWEHNTHIGDARYTDMAEDGLLNLGQLAREGHAAEGVVLVGFGSYRGQVIAGREWDAPRERMSVPPARAGSWEDLLHRAGAEDRLLLFRGDESAELLAPRGHRAIGVVYHPGHEHLGSYLPTVLPRRYDAFLYLDETEALHPLPVPVREDGEVAETFPSGV